MGYEVWENIVPSGMYTCQYFRNLISDKYTDLFWDEKLWEYNEEVEKVVLAKREQFRKETEMRSFSERGVSLPSGWEKITDDCFTGKPYYYNSVTEMSQWD